MLSPQLILKKKVRCGVTTHRQYLTGPDIMAGHFSAPLFYVYPNGLDVTRLEHSLSIVLHRYPALSGRLKKDAHGHAYIDVNDSGVDYKIYKVAGNLPKYGPDYPIQRHARRYYQPIYPWTAFRPDTPLFSVKVFQFDDLGMVVSFTAVHSLVDGSSMWNFLLDWSRTARGNHDVADVIDRDIILGLGSKHLDHPYSKGGILSIGLWKRLMVYARFILGSLGTNLCLYRVPATFVLQLRDQLAKEHPEHPRVSDADLITAHCLKVISSLHKHKRDICIGQVSDLRFRPAVGIPKRLFGVALAQEEFQYSAKELCEKSIGTLALKGRGTGMAHSTEDLKSYLGYMEKHRREKKISRLVPRFLTSRRNNGFMQNNYCPFPVYDIDFGSGSPSFVSPLAVPYRMLKIIPTPEGDGGFDIHLMLSRRELKVIGEQYASP